MHWPKLSRTLCLWWKISCINIPKVNCSKSVSWWWQLPDWFLHLIPISWLWGVLQTQQLLINKTLRLKMRRLIDRRGMSYFMKLIETFIMERIFQLLFCPIRTPHHEQQEISQSRSPCILLWNNFQNPTIRRMEFEENKYLKMGPKLFQWLLRKLFLKLPLKVCQPK